MTLFEQRARMFGATSEEIVVARELDEANHGIHDTDIALLGAAEFVGLIQATMKRVPEPAMAADLIVGSARPIKEKYALTEEDMRDIRQFGMSE